MKEEKKQEQDKDLQAMLGILDDGDMKEIPQFEQIPVIDVDNSKEEAEVTVSGKKKKTKVLCEPRYKITIKNEAGEYKKKPFAPEFNGVIFKKCYGVQKKWKKNSTKPFFFSTEFTGFKGDSSLLSIISGGGEVWSGTYAELKEHEEFAGEYDLYAIIYIYIPDNDSVVRLKMRSVSRSIWWDFVKSTPKTSSKLVKFSAEYDDTKDFPFNKVKFDVVGSINDIKTAERVLEEKNKVEATLNRNIEKIEAKETHQLNSGAEIEGTVVDEKTVEAVFEDKSVDDLL